MWWGSPGSNWTSGSVLGVGTLSCTTSLVSRPTSFPSWYNLTSTPDVRSCDNSHKLYGSSWLKFEGDGWNRSKKVNDNKRKLELKTKGRGKGMIRVGTDWLGTTAGSGHSICLLRYSVFDLLWRYSVFVFYLGGPWVVNVVEFIKRHNSKLN